MEITTRDIFGNRLIALDTNATEERWPAPQIAKQLLYLMDHYRYAPEDMSDSDNRVVWARLIRLLTAAGVSREDFWRKFKISSHTHVSWFNGHSLPARVSERRSLYDTFHSHLSSLHRR